jgi:hypothetical protein
MITIGVYRAVLLFSFALSDVQAKLKKTVRFSLVIYGMHSDVIFISTHVDGDLNITRYRIIIR